MARTPSEIQFLKTSAKIMTICFLVEDKKILLGYKKRGFGADRWNGFGGKVQLDESIAQAAAREMREEAGVEVDAQMLEHRGQIIFAFQGKSQPLEVHIFFVHTYVGTPQESEEMRPQWFNITDIPYEKMWIDDKFWLPQVIAGKKVDAYFLFSTEDTVLEKRVEFS